MAWLRIKKRKEKHGRLELYGLRTHKMRLLDY